jgi:hypothetical protein
MFQEISHHFHQNYTSKFKRLWPFQEINYKTQLFLIHN